MRIKIIIVVLGIFLVVAGCAGLKNLIKSPSLSFTKAEVSGLNWDGLTLNFHFDLENPNPFGVTFSKYSYQLDINNQRFVAGHESRGLTAKANGKTDVVIPVSLRFSEVVRTISSVAGMTRVPVKLSGSASVATSIQDITLPFSASHEFPVPKAPEITINSLRIRNVSPASLDAELDLGVRNPNDFKLDLSNLNYSLNLGGTPIINSGRGSDTNISAGGTTHWKLPIQVPIAQTLIGFLGGRTGNFNFNGSMQVGTPFGKIPLTVNKQQSAEISH